MPREFLGLRNDAMSNLVSIEFLARAARFPFGPSAQLGVCASGFGFRLGFHGTQKGADVYFVTTVRAFHSSHYPSVRYYESTYSKEATTSGRGL